MQQELNVKLQEPFQPRQVLELIPAEAETNTPPHDALKAVGKYIFNSEKCLLLTTAKREQTPVSF